MLYKQFKAVFSEDSKTTLTTRRYIKSVKRAKGTDKTPTRPGGNGLVETHFEYQIKKFEDWIERRSRDYTELHMSHLSALPWNLDSLVDIFTNVFPISANRTEASLAKVVTDLPSGKLTGVTFDSLVLACKAIGKEKEDTGPISKVQYKELLEMARWKLIPDAIVVSCDKHVKANERIHIVVEDRADQIVVSASCNPRTGFLDLVSIDGNAEEQIISYKPK